MNPADRPATEPRTEAGRRLLAMLPDYSAGAKTNRWQEHVQKYADAILAIEAEARATPPSYHANPNHLRSHCLVCTPGIPPYPDGVIAEEPTDEECACGDPKYPDAYCPRHGA